MTRNAQSAREESLTTTAVWIARVYALAIFVTIVVRHIAKTRTRPRAWEIGDWLINYSGGFVRRGLSGDVFMRIADAMPFAGRAPLLVPLVTVQVAAYGLLFFAAARLLRRARASPPFLFLFFSPAFLSFPLFTVGGGFRKEILHFGLLAAACIALTSGASVTVRRVLALAVPPLLVVFVLSHEMLFVLVPYYLLVGWFLLEPRRLSPYLAWSIAAAAGAAVAFAIALAFPGSPGHVDHVCGALLEKGLLPSVCDGAIHALGMTPADARHRLLDMTGAPGFAWRSTVALFLILVPFVFAVRDLRRDPALSRRAKLVLLAAAASAMMTVPLLAVAKDWGRVLHVHVVSMTLLLLTIRAAAEPAVAADQAQPVILPATARLRRGALVAALVLYASAWTVRHVGPVLGPSVVGLARAEWGGKPVETSRGTD